MRIEVIDRTEKQETTLPQKKDFPQSADIFVLCHAYRHSSEVIGLVLSLIVVADSIVKQETNLVQN